MLQQQCVEQLQLLGKLSPGPKKLEGKTFYLDNVKKRPTALLLEAISLLGGSIESFLHRDVSFVVTGSQAGLEEQKTKRNDKSGQRTVKQQESVMSSEKQRPATARPTVCGSRGKALLEKAIRNNERLQGSSVLANARSWGVKILHVDDVLSYLKQLNSERVSAKSNRPERTSTKLPSSHVVVKATSLRSPFVKIEDTSRKYKPLLIQSMTFPSLSYPGRFSPFEPPPPPCFDKQLAPAGNKSRPNNKVESSSKDKSQTPPPWLLRKKNLSYCECCLESFSNLEEHLQSDQHRDFVLEASNYRALDRLVAEMVSRFDTSPKEEVFNRSSESPPILCELEPLTDAEMEHEGVALIGQTDICGPHQDTPLEVQPGISPDDPISNPAASQLSSDRDRLPCPATLTIAVLEVAPQPHLLSPRRDPCANFDPYSLPPVLSPQVLSQDDMEAHSPYSEPPVLSPQNYTTEDYVDVCENTESVSESVPILNCELPVVVAELSQPDAPPVLSKVHQCHDSFLESFTASTHQQWPPRIRKRRRYSSAECSCSKRKRTASGGCGKDVVDSLSDMASFRILQKCCSENVPLLETTSHVDSLASWPLSSHPPNPSSCLCNAQVPDVLFSRDSQQSHSTSVCIDPALIPDVDGLSQSSSEWDCELLPGLRAAETRPASPVAQACELDKDILHRPCAWMHDTSYESRLHTALQLSTPTAEPSAFSRTVVQIVEVQH
uniref:uncharacterized protein dbf4b n=1 Tax=Doryrhamphus excisus TaxID=161450 RepID=UPI0025ADEA4E|nr:uncharacterized protein dbf4b [Doryrhamphus excisus]